MTNNTTNNALNESLIPRDSIVFEYVAGRLSENAKQQFEMKLSNDSELQAAVAFERELCNRTAEISSQNLNSLSANDDAQFESLLERIDAFEELESYQRSNSQVQRKEAMSESMTSDSSALAVAPDQSLLTRLALRTNGWRKSNVYALAASFLVAGFISVFMLSPLSQQLLEPSYTGLSSGDSQVLDLQSLVTEDRIAKLTLASHFESQQVAELLAAYQLELVSQVPEQRALVVLAQRRIETKVLNGWRNDNRIADAELVSLNAEKK